MLVRQEGKAPVVIAETGYAARESQNLRREIFRQGQAGGEAVAL
jgi:hypothetical protein